MIVIAFTRPFFSGGSAAKDNSAAGATVILIDNSLSMRREQLCLPKHKRAEAAVDDARNDEQIALLSFDKRYTSSIASLPIRIDCVSQLSKA